MGDARQVVEVGAHAWVKRKSRKMGARTVTDSFTPRRFIRVRVPMASPSRKSFHGCQAGGSTLKTWSAPLATEVEMVST
jgi:hypothetical protein